MSFSCLADDVSIVRARNQTACASSRAQHKTQGSVEEVMGRFVVDFQMSALQHRIMKRMVSFWTDELVESVLRPILEQHDDAPSIRSIDWCLTNLSKSTPIFTLQQDGKRVNIHQTYKSVLNYFKRRNFDAFRRSLRITVKSEHGDLISTVAQLNFYAWGHVTGVLAYCKTHRHALEDHMNRVSRRREREETNDMNDDGERGCKRAKRVELTQPCRVQMSIVHRPKQLATET